MLGEQLHCRYRRSAACGGLDRGIPRAFARVACSNLAFEETGIGPQSLINLAGVFGFDELRTKSSEAITMAR
jgi:hypothetical protein